MATPNEPVDGRWKMVRCSGCGKEYQCTPQTDYYNATTLTDGVCWDCLIEGAGMKAQAEPPYLGGEG